MVKKKSESSRHEKRIPASGVFGAPLTDRQRRELRALAKLKDEDIDYSDIPPVNVNSGKWEVSKFYRPIKKQISIRVDSDVLSWLRGNHSKYQTYINEVLRREMMAGLK